MALDPVSTRWIAERRVKVSGIALTRIAHAMANGRTNEVAEAALGRIGFGCRVEDPERRFGVSALGVRA